MYLAGGKLAHITLAFIGCVIMNFSIVNLYSGRDKKMTLSALNLGRAYLEISEEWKLLFKFKSCNLGKHFIKNKLL